ncbi:S-adenosylmethionine-dependent methyltransferase [Spraguea lophii 42_110]|uniref:S-adenosylmethionine-dependent methyltransferase n=1 Tax=Spraguea lophii (strain 42_110) TaxID=1358809 RepID=S7XWB8_SPRLO|nr:S-adenosylmethionine-dependent methyltransferase [Spraguea lophii 42_110]
MFCYKFSPLPKYFNMKILRNIFKKHIDVKHKIVYKEGNKHGYLHVDMDNIPNITYKKIEIIFEKVEYKEHKKERVEEDIVDIRDKVTPLWKMEYSEQIKYKENMIMEFYKNNKIIGDEESKEMNKKYLNIKESNNDNDNNGENVDNNNNNSIDNNNNDGKESENKIVVKPALSNLRNKMELTFGIIPKPALGFRGNRNYNKVMEVNEVQFISEILKSKIQEINDNLKDKEQLIFNRETKIGYLKVLLLKEFNDEIISMVGIHCNEEEENNIKKYFTDKTPIDGILNELVTFIENLPFENLYINFSSDNFDGIRNDKNKIMGVRGKDSIDFYFGEYKFKTNFFSFFQCNITFTKIIEDISLLSADGEYLLDLCCGSGVIGILLNKNYKKIIGIENNEDCKNMVEYNLQNNKINNYEFKLGDIKKIREYLDVNQNYSAILDPPRNGVSKDVISWIRESNIKELFYISCDYKQSVQNIKDLMRDESKKYKNEKFNIELVRAYDMFPGTDKMEVMIYMKR